MHLTKEDLALSKAKIEIWVMQQRHGLAVVYTASFIGVVSSDIDMIVVKKRFNIVYISHSVVSLSKLILLWNRTLVVEDKLSSTTVDFIRSEGD